MRTHRQNQNFYKNHHNIFVMVEKKILSRRISILGSKLHFQKCNFQFSPIVRTTPPVVKLTNTVPIKKKQSLAHQITRAAQTRHLSPASRREDTEQWTPLRPAIRFFTAAPILTYNNLRGPRPQPSLRTERDGEARSKDQRSIARAPDPRSALALCVTYAHYSSVTRTWTSDKQNDEVSRTCSISSP